MGEYQISSAWRSRDPRVDQDVLRFWEKFKLLPRGVDPAVRIQELCAVAYLGEELVGVATAALANLQLVRSRVGMFRCAVAPDHRRSGLAAQLALRCLRLLEAWSVEHPEEKLMAMATVLEGNIGDKARQPVWPLTGLTLVGYTPQSQQLRLVWFKHATAE